jgi:hypothetical protein
MRKLLIIAALLATATPALAEVTGKNYHDPKLKRVIVTRPMVSCWSNGDDDAAKKRLDQAMAAWRVNAKLPEGCAMLKVDEQFDLETASNEEAVALLSYCFPGCTPSETTWFAPPRRLTGDYLKPVK